MTLEIKPFDMDNLLVAVSEYKHQLGIVTEKQREVGIMDGKMNQLKVELAEAKEKLSRSDAQVRSIAKELSK